MELRAHDLLRLVPDARVLGDLPIWATDSLHQTRTVVVRRAAAPNRLVSVGIRGSFRGQRCDSLFLRIEDVATLYTPESLIRTGNWRQFTRSPRPFPAWQALEQVNDFAERTGLVYGPIGSVGFQLATGVDSVSQSSDLDVIVRLATAPNRRLLQDFYEANRFHAAPVDVVLEGLVGAVSLTEYLQRPDRVLIKTQMGPRIGAFVW
jgi:phosphoribosyl-dephospho-CoA transferase